MGCLNIISLSLVISGMHALQVLQPACSKYHVSHTPFPPPEKKYSLAWVSKECFSKGMGVEPDTLCSGYGAYSIQYMFSIWHMLYTVHVLHMVHALYSTCSSIWHMLYTVHVLHMAHALYSTCSPYGTCSIQYMFSIWHMLYTVHVLHMAHALYNTCSPYGTCSLYSTCSPYGTCSLYGTVYSDSTRTVHICIRAVPVCVCMSKCVGMCVHVCV